MAMASKKSGLGLGLENVGLHRRNFVCDGGDLSPLLLKVVQVTVTTTFLKQNLYHGEQGCIFSYKNTIFS